MSEPTTQNTVGIGDAFLELKSARIIFVTDGDVAPAQNNQHSQVAPDTPVYENYLEDDGVISFSEARQSDVYLDAFKYSRVGDWYLTKLSESGIVEWANGRADRMFVKPLENNSWGVCRLYNDDATIMDTLAVFESQDYAVAAAVNYMRDYSCDEGYLRQNWGTDGGDLFEGRPVARKTDIRILESVFDHTSRADCLATGKHYESANTDEMYEFQDFLYYEGSAPSLIEVEITHENQSPVCYKLALDYERRVNAGDMYEIE